MNHLALPRLRTASWARAAAVAVAVLLVCWLVVARSTSAFGGSTSNGPNLLSTSSIKLTDDDNGVAMFNVPDMKPLQSEERCIDVTYQGTLLGADLTPVRLSADQLDPAPRSDLAPYLDLTVERGSTCASFGTPTVIYSPGTLGAFLTAHGGYASGLDTGWTPGANPETRAFRFTVLLRDDPGAQGGESRPTFTWEVRSR